MNVQVSKEVKWIAVGVVLMLLGMPMAAQVNVMAIAMPGVLLIVGGVILVAATVAKLFLMDVFPEIEPGEDELEYRRRTRGY
jgi:uncharacterized Tic20 family protein